MPTVQSCPLDQVLLADFQWRTRSWLMVKPMGEGAPMGIRLYSGSAVVPRRNPASGKSPMGFLFNALLGFHKVYSKQLLGAAASRAWPRPQSPHPMAA